MTRLTKGQPCNFHFVLPIDQCGKCVAHFVFIFPRFVYDWRAVGAVFAGATRDEHDAARLKTRRATRAGL
jgi:hypothetical protein